MASPSESAPASEGLATALEPVLGAPVEIAELSRLTGGASRETWSFTGNGEELILRRDPPRRRGAPGAMRREADAMRGLRGGSGCASRRSSPTTTATCSARPDS